MVYFHVAVLCGGLVSFHICSYTSLQGSIENEKEERRESIREGNGRGDKNQLDRND